MVVLSLSWNLTILLSSHSIKVLIGWVSSFDNSIRSLIPVLVFESYSILDLFLDMLVGSVFTLAFIFGNTISLFPFTLDIIYIDALLAISMNFTRVMFPDPPFQT